MTTAAAAVQERVQLLQDRFPAFQFAITQNQQQVLELSLGNLQQSAVVGGVLAVAVLFLFIGQWRLSLLISISIPLSLLYSLLLFKLFDLSLNIISISGIALGTGMLIDNAIIALDVVYRKWKDEQLDLLQAATTGAAEVAAPMLSSVATTLSVFLPLLFLSGKAGALFYEQALAIAATLLASLFVALYVLPLGFIVMFRKASQKPASEPKLYRWFLQFFLWGKKSIGRWPVGYLGAPLLLLLLLGVFAFYKLQLSTLPPTTQKGVLASIRFAEPLSAELAAEKVAALMSAAPAHVLYEAETGRPQLQSQAKANFGAAAGQVQLFVQCATEAERMDVQKWLANTLNEAGAAVAFEAPPTAFTQLFADEQPLLQAKLYPLEADSARQKLLALLPQLPEWLPAKGLRQQQALVYHLKPDMLQRYQLSPQQVIQAIEYSSAAAAITRVQQLNQQVEVKMTSGQSGSYRFRSNTSSPALALEQLVRQGYEQVPEQLFADRLGRYMSLVWQAEKTLTKQKIFKAEAKTSALQQPLQARVQLSGSWYSTQSELRQLLYILAVAVLLLYFILAAQFESLWQPLVVLLTLLPALAGSLLLLWLAGASLNLLSGIGCVIMGGIMVNDAILKLDLLNRLYRSGITTSRSSSYSRPAAAQAYFDDDFYHHFGCRADTVR